MKYMYQVHINGRLHPDIGLDAPTSMVSRKLFASHAHAQAFAPDFITLCTVPREYSSPHTLHLAFQPPVSQTVSFLSRPGHFLCHTQHQNRFIVLAPINTTNAEANRSDDG